MNTAPKITNHIKYDNGAQGFIRRGTRHQTENMIVSSPTGASTKTKHDCFKFTGASTKDKHLLPNHINCDNGAQGFISR